MTDHRLRLAIIGSGPTGTAFLERLLANIDHIAPELALEIHLVDPFPPGAGRVWRHEQSPLMWMNSMAEDVTMFTDESVHCDGPIVPGPPLDEWARLVTDELLPADVVEEVHGLVGTSFPTRQLQSAYLTWVFDRVISQAPAHVRVIQHVASAVDLTDTGDGRQMIHLSDETTLVADAVVLSLGHLDVDPTPEHASLASFAGAHDLAYLPPAYTADIDLDLLKPGAPTIVRGFGVAFIDLMVLLTEGRGGRYVDDALHGLRYEPSGREPLLVVGSRRGVPYHSKIDYSTQLQQRPRPRFFDNEAIARLVREHRSVDFHRHVWPLLAKDVAHGYYYELFHAHPQRTAVAWDEFDRRLGELEWGDPLLDALVAEAVPDAADRLDITRLDRPLAGIKFGSFDDLQEHLRSYIAADRARRADTSFSADLGAFYALLAGYGQMAHLSGSGKVSPRSMVKDVNGWWHGFFSFFASGPPGPRLDQLLALSRAGVVQFLGSDMWVEADAQRGLFRAGSVSHDHVVEAVALVEARLPSSSVSRTRSALLAALRDRGEVAEQILTDDRGSVINTGKVLVTAELEIIQTNGEAHPRRFALGIHTGRPASGTFARPRTNALPFRQNDAVARRVLTVLSRVATEPARVRRSA